MIIKNLCPILDSAKIKILMSLNFKEIEQITDFWVADKFSSDIVGTYLIINNFEEITKDVCTTQVNKINRYNIR